MARTLAGVVGTWWSRGPWAPFWKFRGDEGTLASGEAEGTAGTKAKRTASFDTVDNREGETWVRRDTVGAVAAGPGGEASVESGSICCRGLATGVRVGKAGTVGARDPFPALLRSGGWRLCCVLHPAKGKLSP